MSNSFTDGLVEIGGDHFDLEAVGHQDVGGVGLAAPLADDVDSLEDATPRERQG